MTIELVANEDVRRQKGNYNNIRCRLCKNNDTRKLSNGDFIWTKDIDMEGNWTGQFLCYDCYFNKEKICYKCGAEQIIKAIHMTKFYDRYGLWTGKYICINCRSRENKNYRNSNISMSLKEGGGSLTDIIVATILEIQTCSIYIVDKKIPFCLVHDYYGIIGVKNSRLKNNRWYFNINDYISADTYFLLGFDKFLKNIDAVYIIPVEKKAEDKRISSGRLSISKNSEKYKDFQVDHEPYNNIFHNLNVGESLMI